MKKIGFIGMGNMAQALAIGFLKSGKINKENLYAYAPTQAKLKTNAEKIGFIPCTSPKELVESSDIVIMACKPYQIESVLKIIGEDLAGKALLSIAAGWDFAMYEKYLNIDEKVRFQFIMPNTPVSVGEGVMIFEERNTLAEDERSWILEMMGSLGMVTEFPGNLLNAATSVTGCGPAFIDMIMEAMADAAVKHGIKRDQAYALIAQMVLGSGKLLLQSGLHPGQLKDNVCSPGGTTIRGVDALEHAGVRAAFIDAVDAVIK